jgi:hypothetical protein
LRIAARARPRASWIAAFVRQADDVERREPGTEVDLDLDQPPVQTDQRAEKTSLLVLCDNQGATVPHPTRQSFQSVGTSWMQDVQSHTIELPPVAMSRMGLLVAPCSDDRSQPQQEQAVLLVARLTENSIGVEGNFLDDAGKVLQHTHMIPPT